MADSSVTTISLPTSPEQRRALSDAGFAPAFMGPLIEQWHRGGFVFTLREGLAPGIMPLAFTDYALPLELALEFAVLLGIQSSPPPGYVLVPVETAKRSKEAIQYLANEYRVAAPKWRKRGMAETAVTCENDAKKLDEHEAILATTLGDTQPSGIPEKGEDSVRPTAAQRALLEDLATTTQDGLPRHGHAPETFHDCVDKGWLREERDDSSLGNLWIVHPMVVTRFYLTDEGRKVLETTVPSTPSEAEGRS